jgi:hypothetical protein
MRQWHSRYLPRTVPLTSFQVGDPQLMWTIHTDVVRTGRHIFFLPPGDPPEGAPDNLEGMYAGHMRRIERILYVFSNQDPTMSYLQGFNDLVTLLYYVNQAAITYLGGNPDDVEGLTFFCLDRLLSGTDIRSFYPKAEGSPVIRDRMNAFMALVKRHLPKVHEVLGCLEIDPLEFAVRWFTLLYAQDYQLPVILCIWDSLFVHLDDLMGFVGYVVIAHLELVEDKLSPTDVAVTMHALQHARTDNIAKVLNRAHVIWTADGEAATKRGFSLW